VISLRNVPYFIILLASALPIVSAVFDSKLLTFLPDILALLFYFLFLSCYPQRAGRLNIYVALVLVLLAFHICIGVLTGRGIGSGGIVSVFVLTFIFSKFLETGSINAARDITRQISVIYIVHVACIFFEMIALINGYQDVFAAISSNATGVIYKTYNSAALLKYIGFRGVGGMNSLLLGSQIASMLVLYSVFWFAPLFKGRSFSKDRIMPMFWFTFSILLFPFAATMTATFVFVLMVVMMIYMLPNSIVNRKAIWFLAPVLSVLFSGVLTPLLFYRINNNRDIDIYINTFLASPKSFADLPLLDQLIGYGADIRSAPISDADFGLGMLTFQVGLLLIGMALICMLAIILLVIRAVKIERYNGTLNNPWAALASVNILCAVGWGASLIHYTQAVELGGRHIFSLHLAVCLVSLIRLKSCMCTGNSVSKNIAFRTAG
jgi:hypothetical protein